MTNPGDRGSHAVVRRFLGDLHVVNVGLVKASAGDLYEFRLGAHFLNIAAAGVTHGGAQAAHQLVDDGAHHAFIRHATFDAFRYQFFGTGIFVLEVAVGAALVLGHRAHGPHAAVGFVGTALVKLDFTRRFFGTGQQATYHHGACASGNGFGQVAREADAAIGKTLVSSSMIDRVAHALGRKLAEVPVGFKWFVDGLVDGSYGFGGEESAGASFLRKDGSVWTTDKDGIILDLLAAEITAKTGEDPAQHYAKLEAAHGSPIYERIDAPASPEQKAVLKKLSPEQVSASELAGEEITAKLTEAPGNGAAIGGLKVVTENGWFAARPSGTWAAPSW